MTTKVTSRLSD